MNRLLSRITQMSRELKLFAAASFTMGIGFSIVDATFNNFLNARFDLSGFARSFLEFPRELPGFLVMFVSALLWFLCSRRLGAIAMLFAALGVLCMGFLSPTYGIMLIWLFLHSLGLHIFIPLSSTIGMELAKHGQDGQRLGQINAIRNVAAIVGSFLVYIGFKFLGFTFQLTFTISAFVLGIAAVLMFAMTPEKTQHPTMYLKLRREYGLYYLLSVLYGSRKQIFITFAPWVLVTIFHQPTQTIATLLTIGGVIGILFQPLLGWATDRFGERLILTMEAGILVFVCAGYGFAKFLFTEQTAFLIACGCYLLDQMLMSVNMARATYMKKIARRAEDIQPALTASVSIDHLFSIVLALIGGLIWNVFGFQYVFLLGAVIALANFVAARHIKVERNV